MENQNSGGKRWSPDAEAGSIIKRIFDNMKPIPKSDVRIDVLINVGLVLGEKDRVYFERERMEVARAVSDAYTLYSVSVDDGLVFDAVYRGKTLELGEFIFGPWCTALNALVRGSLRLLEVAHA